MLSRLLLRFVSAAFAALRFVEEGSGGRFDDGTEGLKDEENEEVGRTLAARSRSTLDRRICDTVVNTHVTT